MYEAIPSDSFLEYAFLRWVLHAVARPEIIPYVYAQAEIQNGSRKYKVDYEIRGEEKRFVVELDGFTFHSSRNAFTYDRLRQNDLLAAGKLVLRFTYDSIRRDSGTCAHQLIAAFRMDPLLNQFLIETPVLESPEMDPDPIYALANSPSRINKSMTSYFDAVRTHLNHDTLRECQREAFAALASYYGNGGTNAACVMSVGAGKTVLGVLSVLAFTKRRAMVITPGNVIRGTFDKAFDHEGSGNALYALPGGPLIPGMPPPKVLTLDREDGTMRGITRDELLSADVIVTNFHSVGNGNDPDDLLSKLSCEDIDFLVIDEAHIAASDSYLRAFAHYSTARTFLMSACFQRLDGKPIDADVVYRYRLIDSIADGHAKNLRIHRFQPNVAETTYEIVWPDGFREEIVGRDALVAIINDERKIAHITAKSTEPIRQVMRAVQECLKQQAHLLYPVKPRVLFSALGERHAEQIASIAEECGIPCAHLHHSMSEARIKSVRQRFESPSGDLLGIVQLKMLGQGYDFPPICVVVPMRPYGSFSEFYQFVGRGIRVITHPSFSGRVNPSDQFLDVIYHAEMDLDRHVETIYKENDMDPITSHDVPESWQQGAPSSENGFVGHSTAGHPQLFVLFEVGTLEQRIVHDQGRVEQRKQERRIEALAQRYSIYAQSTENPVSFAQFQEILTTIGN